MAIDLHAGCIYDVNNPPFFPNIDFRCFSNAYPLFTDTNNLSLVAFVNFDDMGIIFPGDLEKAGWRELLRNEDFRDHLSRVNIFVASHHGRESGYCEAIFEFCTPDIVIISDKEIVHETQKQRYTKHAIGVPWKPGSERRYALTTRSDGMITIKKEIGRGYQILI